MRSKHALNGAMIAGILTAAIGVATQPASADSAYQWLGGSSASFTDKANWYPNVMPTGGSATSPVGAQLLDVGMGTPETYQLTYDPANNSGITDPTYYAGDLQLGYQSAATMNVASGSLTFADGGYGSSVINIFGDGASTLNVDGGTVSFLDPNGGPALYLSRENETTAGWQALVNVTNGTLNADGGITLSYNYFSNTITVGTGGVVNVNQSDQSTPAAGTTNMGFGSKIILENGGIYSQNSSYTITFNNHGGSFSQIAFGTGPLTPGTLSLFDGTNGANMSAAESEITTAAADGYIASYDGSAFTNLSASQLSFTQQGNQLLVTVAATPEPASLGLLGLALGGLLLLHRRKATR